MQFWFRDMKTFLLQSKISNLKYWKTSEPQLIGNCSLKFFLQYSLLRFDRSSKCCSRLSLSLSLSFCCLCFNPFWIHDPNWIFCLRKWGRDEEKKKGFIRMIKAREGPDSLIEGGHRFRKLSPKRLSIAEVLPHQISTTFCYFYIHVAKDAVCSEQVFISHDFYLQR